MLALEGVCFSHGATTVLRDLNLRVADGEAVALLGPSGAGKSTILRLMLGLLVPERGVVSVRGRVASEAGRIVIPPEERQLAVVFQDLALWPHLTVAQNLAFVLRSRERGMRDERDRIEAMLARVGLSGVATRYPGELSGGEQQRVALARALVTSPGALLLDEPLANLDVALKGELLDLLGELLDDGTTATVFVTHDPREAARLARRMAIVEAGRLVQDDPLEVLRARPATPFVKRLADCS